MVNELRSLSLSRPAALFCAPRRPISPQQQQPPASMKHIGICVQQAHGVAWPAQVLAEKKRTGTSAGQSKAVQDRECACVCVCVRARARALARTYVPNNQTRRYTHIHHDERPERPCRSSPAFPVVVSRNSSSSVSERETRQEGGEKRAPALLFHSSFLGFDRSASRSISSFSPSLPASTFRTAAATRAPSVRTQRRKP